MPHESRRAAHGSYFDPNDPSIHMLGLPKSHGGLRNWCVFAILAGTLFALAVLVLGDFIF
jgi:hypothetical protein